MKEPTMLYKSGTMHRVYGKSVDWTIVDAPDIPKYIEQGWHRSPMDVDLPAPEPKRRGRPTKKVEEADAPWNEED